MQIHWRIETFETLGSTQDLLKERAHKADASEGLVIQALSQSGGKGRQGRIWQSPPGNLYLSLLLRPNLQIGQAGQFAFVAALAVYETACVYVTDLKLKWPNDVHCHGKKLAGVLIEAQDDALLIGIGLNVKSAPDIGISLGDHDVSAVRDRLLENISRFYSLLRSEGFDEIRRLWLERAYPAGTAMNVNGVSGVFESIDPDGSLLLRDSHNKQHRITAGDVALIGS